MWPKELRSLQNIFTKQLLITQQYAIETKADVASSLFHSLPVLTFMP